MRYNASLDGLRALSAFMVVALHTHVPGFVGGAIGVDIFFVLSGYLITSILLEEKAATGRIDLPRFYVRRARRLYPALVLFLAAYLALAPLLWPGKPHARDALLAGLYLSDYTLAFGGIPFYLGHTWSLAVEEHFYLLWPIALIAMLKSPSMEQTARRLLFFIAIAWTWRLANQYALWGQVGYRFDTRMSGLLGGCWLALILRRNPSWARSERTLTLIGWVGAALVVVNLLWRDTAWVELLRNLPLPEVAGLCLVLGASRLPLRSPWLVHAGKLSYGIYLWHFPIAIALNGTPWYLSLPIVLGLSTLAAQTSFSTVEAWFRSRRPLQAQLA